MSGGPHRYSVYGVTITSDWPLAFPPSINLAAPVAEVAFVDGTDEDFSGVAAVTDPAAHGYLPHVFPDGATYVRWSGLYECRIPADGSRVVCRPLNGSDRTVLQNYLFGQALSFALVFQGLEPLHAAVLSVDEVAIGFLGDSFFGKSTMGACFLQAGHRILTDDVLMLIVRDGQWVALPGSGRIKLHPDSARVFLRETDRGEPLNVHTLKRSFPLDECRVQRKGLPLKHLFVLPTREERKQITSISIQPLSRASLFQELLKNTSNAEILTPARLERQFRHAARVAGDIDGFAVKYPEGLHHLPFVCQAIVDHVRRIEAEKRGTTQ